MIAKQTSIHHQRGTVLVASLIFLLVLTLLGVVSLRNSATVEKIAVNMQERQRALTSAESALRDVEGTVQAATSIPALMAVAGWYTAGNAPDPFNYAIWNSSSTAVITTSYGVVAPRYFVEYIGDFTASDVEFNISNYGEETG